MTSSDNLGKQADTQAIAKRFDQAYHSYRTHATVQADMASRLMASLVAYSRRTHFGQVLEIGCGSGLLTDEFAKVCTADEMYLNDLYPQIRHNPKPSQLADAHYQYLIGDARTLALPDGLELIISGAAMQWMYPLDMLMDKLYQSLGAGGYVALSTFGPQNLWQIKHLTGQGLTYHSIDELSAILTQAGFGLDMMMEYEQTLSFDTPMAVLRHLQQTGVTATASQFRWTKQRLQAFCQEYHAMSDEQGVALTYQPMLIIAHKV